MGDGRRAGWDILPRRPPTAATSKTGRRLNVVSAVRSPAVAVRVLGLPSRGDDANQCVLLMR